MSSGRKMTPRGQMTRSANSGPAVMMMPNHIRATFMPNPPLKSIPPRRNHRKHTWTGVSDYLIHFETNKPKERIVQATPITVKKEKAKQRQSKHEDTVQPKIDDYRREQRDCGGEYHGMNCYNTLFVGRLAYEVTERKLLREMETFGPVKDIKIVKDKKADSNSSSGGGGRSKYAFVEYENEEDMKRAYRAVDGMKIEGREVVVDVERGHTVPTWLPRRLGGGLGGTRLGGKDKNVKIPGRFDPNRPDASRPAMPMMMDGPPGPVGMGRGHGHGHGPPPMPYGGGGGGGPGGGGGRGGGFGPPPGGPYGPPYGGGGGGYGGRGGGGGRDWGDRGGGGPGGGGRYNDGGRKRHRSRSRSPESRRYAPRGRY